MHPAAVSLPPGADVQGPPGVPVFGNLFEFSRAPHLFLQNLARDYGDIARMRFGPLTAYAFVHPDHIAEFLVTAHQKFIKDPVMRGLGEFVGNGLLLNEGEPWKRQRKLAAPVLSRKHVAAYAEAMVRHTHRLAQHFDDDTPRDVHVDMTDVTLSIVAEVLFGLDLSQAVKEIGEEVETFLEFFLTNAQGWQRVLPRWVPTPIRSRLRRHLRRFDDRLYRVLHERRAAEGIDLLSRLSAARDDDGQPMSDLQLRDEAATMLMAGHETTAANITFALCLLSRDPEALRRATEEVRATLGDADPTAEHDAALPFTKAVVKEALRLFPPAYVVGREAIEPHEIGGVEIRKGQMVNCSAWVVHRDPRWYDDPLAFRPERWLSDLEARLPRLAFMPFGAGPRICIGNHFAALEALLVIARLLRDFDLEWAGSGDVEAEGTVTLRPKHRVAIRFRRRAR